MAAAAAVEEEAEEEEYQRPGWRRGEGMQGGDAEGEPISANPVSYREVDPFQKNSFAIEHTTSSGVCIQKLFGFDDPRVCCSVCSTFCRMPPFFLYFHEFWKAIPSRLPEAHFSRQSKHHAG